MKRIINSIACGIACLMLLPACSMTQKSHTPVALTAKDKKVSCISFAAVPHGTVALSWAEQGEDTEHTSFYFALWNEQQDTFLSPVSVPLETHTSFMEENKPMVVFQSPDTVWAVYSVQSPTPENKYASFIHYRISMDGGQTWSPPESLLHDTVPGKSRSFANAVALPDGRVAFAWMGGMLDMKSIPGRALYYATAEGPGHHSSPVFSSPVLIDSFACPCCRSALACTPTGKVAIAYRSVRKDNIRDIAFAYKKAGDTSFSRPVVFSQDHWQIDGCPEDGPSLVITDEDNWVGWFSGGSEKGTFYARLDNQGKVLHKEPVERNSRFINLARLPDGNNAVIYNNTMAMNGKEASMIELRRTERRLLPAHELDTADYYATRPIVIPRGDHNDLLTAWIAEGRLWYRSE